MRKLTGAAFVSLDGVMQAPGEPTEDPTGDFGQGGRVFGIGDEVIDPVLGELFNPHCALLLGRRTYDIFAATGGSPPDSLRLLDHQVGAKGVIVTRWARAGQIPTVNHPHPSTSAAEAERQRRMKEGA
jgi:hypothetical protein